MQGPGSRTVEVPMVVLRSGPGSARLRVTVSTTKQQRANKLLSNGITPFPKSYHH